MINLTTARETKFFLQLWHGTSWSPSSLRSTIHGGTRHVNRFGMLWAPSRNTITSAQRKMRATKDWTSDLRTSSRQIMMMAASCISVFAVDIWRERKRSFYVYRVFPRPQEHINYFYSCSKFLMIFHGSLLSWGDVGNGVWYLQTLYCCFVLQ